MCVKISNLCTIIVVSTVGAVITVGPPPELRVLNSTLAIINCTSEGYPQPTISWRKSGEEVLPDGDRVVVETGGSLIIRSVMMSDAGDYRCVATNAVDQDVGDTSTLFVDGKYSLYFVMCAVKHL